MPKVVVIPALAGALAVAFAVAHAAPQSGGQTAAPAGKPEAAAPGAQPGETKPEETAPPAAGASEPAQPETAPASLGELTKDGFEIRTTAFIPADAVTRQSGKVSSDAIVVTLQKTAATAICFYTLKAYVSRKLTTIPACTIHR
jgi:hypothetical protein